MKFVELKPKLKRGEVLSVYVVKGEDDFVKNIALKMIVDNVVTSFQELNVSVMTSDEIIPQKVIDACNTMPFMAEKKVIAVKENEKKLSQELAGLLKDYVKNPNPSTVLVLINGDNSSFSKLPAESIDCNRLDAYTVSGFIKQKVGKTDIKINDLAIKKLMEYTNGYLGKIDLELDKLLSAADGEITKELVEEMVNKDLEYSIFELTDCISNGRNDRAIKIIDDLMQDYKTNKLILGLLQNHFRRLMFVSLSKQSTKEIADFLGVKEFAVQKAKELASKYKKMSLIKINKMIAETDFFIKSGRLNLKTGIYMLVENIFCLLNV